MHCYLCRDSYMKRNHLRCGSFLCTSSTSDVIPCMWAGLAIASSIYIHTFLISGKLFTKICLCFFSSKVMQCHPHTYGWLIHNSSTCTNRWHPTALPLSLPCQKVQEVKSQLGSKGPSPENFLTTAWWLFWMQHSVIEEILCNKRIY